jgi:hypothetical protein
MMSVETPMVVQLLWSSVDSTSPYAFLFKSRIVTPTSGVNSCERQDFRMTNHKFLPVVDSRRKRLTTG